MTRRIASYPARDGWQALNDLSTAGSYVLALAVAVFLVNVRVVVGGGARRRAGPVAGPHARVGDELAAAAPELRGPAAADPLVRAAVGPAPPARAGAATCAAAAARGSGSADGRCSRPRRAAGDCSPSRDADGARASRGGDPAAAGGTGWRWLARDLGRRAAAAGGRRLGGARARAGRSSRLGAWLGPRRAVLVRRRRSASSA